MNFSYTQNLCCRCLTYSMVCTRVMFLLQCGYWCVCYYWLVITENIARSLNRNSKHPKLISNGLQHFNTYSHCNKLWSEGRGLYCALWLRIPDKRSTNKVDYNSCMQAAHNFISSMICINKWIDLYWMTSGDWCILWYIFLGISVELFPIIFSKWWVFPWYIVWYKDKIGTFMIFKYENIWSACYRWPILGWHI